MTPYESIKYYTIRATILNSILLLFVCLSSCQKPALAHSTPIKVEVKLDIPKLCEAIRQAENSTSHPYGIMKKYEHTSPKQACVNTIKHAYKVWTSKNEPEDFITFLGRTYSPPSVNPYWVKNVSYFYEKG